MLYNAAVDHSRRLPRLIVTAAAVIVVAALAVMAAQPGPPGLADLQRVFLDPPDEARIMMRWWWFGPTVTKAGLEREMRLMKEGGIGGFEIQPVYPVVLDDPARGLVTHPFLSDAFLDHVRFAAAKARELGLRVDLTVGSGWPYGGPSVGISHAAGKLRIERATAAADVMRVPVPDIRTGERLMAAFLAPIAPATSTEGLREVTAIEDGVLTLPDRAAHAREVLFFIASRSGMMVKRPAVGAEGFVLNHYNRAAVDHYLREVGDRLLTAFDNVPPYAVFCDSLEVYESDWTDDFLEAFKARRGYDLRPLLPALVLDAGPATAAIRHDWGQTLTELLNERFLVPAEQWAARHGTKFRLQGYGIPPATISANAGVDLPEGEGNQWKALRASRWAASIGHLYGRPVISSETWTWLHSPSFMASPLDMKAEADVHFLQGINQLIGHGWPYTADGVAYPGWRFYAAGVFNEKNPWWSVMPDVSRYLQRVSALLRQGDAGERRRPLPAERRCVGRLRAGEGRELHRRAGPARSAPTSCRRSSTPASTWTSWTTRCSRAWRKPIRARSRSARTGTAPSCCRTWNGCPRRRFARSRDSRSRAWACSRRGGRPGARLDTRRARPTTQTCSRRLTGCFAAPRRPASSSNAMRTSARRWPRGSRRTWPSRRERRTSGSSIAARGAADLYFVANTSNTPRSIEATFRVAARRWERWDPLDGTIVPGTTRRAPGGAGATISLELAPYGSAVIVFPSSTDAAPETPAAPRARRRRLQSTSAAAGV